VNRRNVVNDPFRIVARGSGGRADAVALRRSP
jgi:hypothetical protein